MGRAVNEISSVFNRYWTAYKQNHNISPDQAKTIGAIQKCRTRDLGSHLEICDNTSCNHIEIAYNSCRNRHCCKCQYSKQLHWVYDRIKELLPIPHYHHVFTLPHLLNDLALCNKRVIYDLFFKAAAYTLNRFSADSRFLNGQLGFFGILHTWGRTLSYHVHLHFIITGGGLEPGGRFKRLPYQKKFLFPSRAMSKVIRARFVVSLVEAYRQKQLRFPGKLQAISSRKDFLAFCKQIGQQSWYNYTQVPFAGPAQVVKYISQYSHRVAISNHRIKSINEGKVRFSYKDYKDESKLKEMTLTADHFIQRFLWHLLPSGFKRIRYYGIFSPGNRPEKLPLARRLLKEMNQLKVEIIEQHRDILEEFKVLIEHTCPKCNIGHIQYHFPSAFYNST